MNLAKPRIDIGLFTNNLAPMLAFYQNEIGLAFDHTLPLGGGRVQHRHDLLGSVLKINESRDPIPETPPSGYRELLIAKPSLLGPKRFADPDGNAVTLVPPGLFGITRIGIKLAVRDLAAHRRFYALAMELPDVPEEGGLSFYCGDSVIMLEAAKDAPSDASINGTGFRYITVQVFKTDDEHAGVLARGGREGQPPQTLGKIARISFIRDPDGNWIEISQRASLTGSLE
ncbi:MAG: VOC family protein [Parvibaculum sp.]|uniref:VOC family protein n=1 Tax=Parvibaculum sp. TaxID=2024848 RepID=UPI0025F200C2|nr:VOC family protein [Parvibaculum sp.]MCE9649185.1 VOC family protein [Parvibaculum sp.]